MEEGKNCQLDIMEEGRGMKILLELAFNFSEAKYFHGFIFILHPRTQ
jgi:hypothetical protein